MDELITKTLECIEKESGKFDKSFDYADLILNKYGEHNLADSLYDKIDHSIKWKNIADLYCIFIWTTSDNGAQFSQITNRWITECNCERKINIALHLDIYPFLNEREMAEKLKFVSNNFPTLSSRCIELINSRMAKNV